MTPIWQDTEVSAGYNVWTRIRKDSSTGDIIFHGRTTEYTSAVHLNGVCADYLRDDLPAIDEAEEFTVHNPVSFYLESAPDGGTWTVEGGAQFYPNWSYDWEFKEKAGPLTMAPSREVTLGQYLLITVMAAPGTVPEATTLVLKGTRKDGTAYTYSMSVPAGAMIGTGVFTLSQFAAVGDVLEVAGLKFTVVDACTRYVLYWFNDYGGWEQILIRNGAPQSDSVTRYTAQTGNNQANWFGRDRAIKEYANATERTMRLGTGWLDDAGSLRMRGLFSSTNVILFDTQASGDNGRFIPLVLTGDSLGYKTYKSNGGQMVRYDFDARVALNFSRRCGK